MFVKYLDIVMHEVWMTSEETDSKPGDAKRHAVFEEVLKIMNKSNVSRLIPAHLNPGWNEKRIAGGFF